MLRRSTKIFLLAMFTALILFGCQGTGGSQAQDTSVQEDVDTTYVQSLHPDSVLKTELETEITRAEKDSRLDGNFDDFLFSFIRSAKLQRKRVLRPLPMLDKQGNALPADSFDVTEELQLLKSDYYTLLYADDQQFHTAKVAQDSAVVVERISLLMEQIRRYHFVRQNGRWMLCAVQDIDFVSSELADFLTFYARFSQDSLFQTTSVSQPLFISISDPEDELNYIEGTIDASQWSSFCPEIPQGVISNICYGQHFSIHQMQMLKCGQSNGLQEIFTFHRTGEGWKLTKYEN